MLRPQQRDLDEQLGFDVQYLRNPLVSDSIVVAHHAVGESQPTHWRYSVLVQQFPGFLHHPAPALQFSEALHFLPHLVATRLPLPDLMPHSHVFSNCQTCALLPQSLARLPEHVRLLSQLHVAVHNQYAIVAEYQSQREPD